jgi:hypothetical protein
MMRLLLLALTISGAVCAAETNYTAFVWCERSESFRSEKPQGPRRAGTP